MGTHRRLGEGTGWITGQAILAEAIPKSRHCLVTNGNGLQARLVSRHHPRVQYVRLCASARSCMRDSRIVRRAFSGPLNMNPTLDPATGGPGITQRDRNA